MKYCKINTINDLPTNEINKHAPIFEPSHTFEGWQYGYVLDNDFINLLKYNFVEIDKKEFMESIKGFGTNPKFNNDGRIIFDAPEGTLAYIIQNGE